jgi:hypothetical protein
VSVKILERDKFREKNAYCHSLSMIPQRYSWGELQITRDGFQRIMAHFDVSEGLLNVVLEFGSKVRHELPRSCTNSLVNQVHTVSSSNLGFELHARERHGINSKFCHFHLLKLYQRSPTFFNTSRETDAVAAIPGRSARPESTLRRTAAPNSRTGSFCSFRNR